MSGSKIAPEHKQRVRLALKRHGFPSQNALAISLGLCRATITSFFNGKPVAHINFIEISERLGLDWEEIVYKEDSPFPEKPASPPDTALNGTSEKKGLGSDWRQLCRDMLETQHQRRLTTNPLTAGDGVAFELDEIYVPLGLVERKHRDRRIGDVSPEKGSRVYEPETQDEIIKTFEQDEFFEQVLRFGRSRRTAIIGEPGAGKTTLLQKIAAWVVDNTEDVPIWISLADLQGKSLKEYLLCDWLEAATRKVRLTEEMQEALGELFNSKRVWLLLDAADEMAVGVGAQGLAPLQWIANQLRGWVADARVVLTCRLNVWDAGKNALEAFETYRNLDFSYGDAQTSDQVKQFIRCWFKSKPVLAERLRAELDQPGRERIKDAVKNPLRLALLCRTWALGQGELPNTKAGLYQQFTEALYEWKQERFPTTSTQRRQLNKALGELAKRAIAEEKTKFRLRHRLVCEVLGKPDEDLFELALQLGWVNQVGVAAEAENRGEKVYAFYHPTFQEYFAAQAIDDWHYFLNHVPHNPAQGTYRSFEPSWKEVILLWLGREDVAHEQKEEFIKTLVEFQDGCGEDFFNGSQYRGFYEYRAYLLAASGIAEFGDCSQSAEIVTQLVKWGFGYFNWEKQKWVSFFEPIQEGARTRLLDTERSRAISALVQLIKTAKLESTGWQAAYTLGKIDPGNPEAMAALVQSMKSTKDRWQAAYTLGKIDPDNPEAIAALVQLMKSTKDASILLRTVHSLGKINPGNPAAIAALVQLIESIKDEFIRWQAVHILGEIGTGNSQAISALVQLLESTENESTCWQAAYSLGKIDPGNPAVIVALVKLLDSTANETTRSRVTHSIGKFGSGNPEAIAALVRLIESTEDEFTRRRAAYSLGEIGTSNPEAIAALVRLIESTEDEFTRSRAAYSLGKIDPSNPKAITALVQLLEPTENVAICLEAAYSLGKIDPGNSKAIAALVQLMESTEDEFIRRQIAINLGEIGTGNQAAIAALVKLIRSTEDKFTCKRAVESLGKIDSGNPIAVAVLVQLIQSNKDKSIRRETANTFKGILLIEQLGEVVTALKDNLSYENYENNFKRFEECYKLIWHCAQNMSYPAFYQAWHSPPTPQPSSMS